MGGGGRVKFERARIPKKRSRWGVKEGGSWEDGWGEVREVRDGG